MLFRSEVRPFDVHSAFYGNVAYFVLAGVRLGRFWPSLPKGALVYFQKRWPRSLPTLIAGLATALFQGPLQEISIKVFQDILRNPLPAQTESRISFWMLLRARVQGKGLGAEATPLENKKNGLGVDIIYQMAIEAFWRQGDLNLLELIGSG